MLVHKLYDFKISFLLYLIWSAPTDFYISALSIEPISNLGIAKINAYPTNFAITSYGYFWSTYFAKLHSSTDIIVMNYIIPKKNTAKGLLNSLG
jgi:hypothetical protein